MSNKIDFEELKKSGILPSPQGVALTVIQLCQKDEVPLPELARTIQGDPALSGLIIKMANAVNVNKNRPIASVTVDTLIIVGIQAIRQVVLGFSLVSGNRQGKCEKFDYAHFWLHSAAMACAAQTIGSTVRIAPLPEVFICGLLAEIGQLGLATARAEIYSKLLEHASNKPISELMQAETKLFGMNRHALTKAMMTDWGMPALFIEVVSSYDDPEAAGFSAGTRPFNFAIALQLAAQMADLYLTPGSDQPALFSRMLQTGASLDLNAEQVLMIADSAASGWLEWVGILGIQKPASLNLQFKVPD